MISQKELVFILDKLEIYLIKSLNSGPNVPKIFRGLDLFKILRYRKFQLIWITGKIFKQPELKYARLGVPYCT